MPSWARETIISLDPQGDEPHYLWVSDKDTNRVFRAVNPVRDPKVDTVLGQADATSYGCNRGASTFEILLLPAGAPRRRA